jgi:hypothetical protein
MFQRLGYPLGNWLQETLWQIPQRLLAAFENSTYLSEDFQYSLIICQRVFTSPFAAFHRGYWITSGDIFKRIAAVQTKGQPYCNTIPLTTLKLKNKSKKEFIVLKTTRAGVNLLVIYYSLYITYSPSQCRETVPLIKYLHYNTIIPFVLWDKLIIPNLTKAILSYQNEQLLW